MNTTSPSQSRRFGQRLFTHARALLAVSALAALAVPSQLVAQSINFPNPTVQVPWATGKTAFGHIKTKTGALDVLGSGLSQFPNYAQVWLNDGSGNFTMGAQLPAQQGNAEGFTLADLNGDGFDDAIVVSRGSIAIYLNNGTGDGSFGSPTAYFYNNVNYFPAVLGNIQPLRVAAGKTSTGKWNLAVTGAAQVAWGLLYSVNSDGTLAPNPQLLLTGGGYARPDLEFVDVNKSGVPSLVVKAVWGGPVAVFANDGSGNFGNRVTNGALNYQTATFSLPAADANYFQSGVQFIDMDHDSILDMVVLTADGTGGWVNTVYWYKGLGNSAYSLTPHTAWAGGPSPARAFSFQTNAWSPGVYLFTSAADFDGDGQIDLAMGNQLTQPTILKNNGDGTFSPAWSAPLTDSLGRPAFAQFISFVNVTGIVQKSLVGANHTNNSSQRYTPYGEFYGTTVAPLPPTPTLTASAPVLTVPGNITVNATSAAGAAVTFNATATSTESMEIFRRDTVTAEVWKSYTTTFTSGVTGSFTLGFNVVSAAGRDNSIFIDAVKVTSGAGTLLADGFETPALAQSSGVFADTGNTTLPVTLGSNWTFTNYGGILQGPSAPHWGSIANGAPPDGSQRAVLRDVISRQTKMKSAGQISLVAGQVYTVTFQQASREIFGGALTYTVTLEREVSVPVTATPASGSTFPIRNTTVNLSATNSAGGTTAGSFTVTVKGTPPMITAASSLTVEATSPAGASPAIPATATDFNGASLPVTVSPAGPYAIGITQVNLSATDSNGLTTTKQIVVYVVDTTAPVIAAPASQTLEATSAAGAVATFAATATDAVGPVTLTYSSASGSTFGITTTVVTVTAKDAYNNSSTSSFTIEVQDTKAPVFARLTASSATLWPANHKMVAITLAADATDIVGVKTLKIIGVTSSEPDNGLGDGDTAGDIVVTGNLTVNLRAERSGTGNGRTYTITVEAKDAAGNASTKTCTVFVPKSQPGK